MPDALLVVVSTSIVVLPAEETVTFTSGAGPVAAGV